jgi:hypothetical protein
MPRAHTAWPDDLGASSSGVSTAYLVDEVLKVVFVAFHDVGGEVRGPEKFIFYANLESWLLATPPLIL